MSGKFLTAKEIFNFLWNLDNNVYNDLVDTDNELVTLHPDADALKETEEIDDSPTKKIKERVCDYLCPKEVAVII